MSKRMTRRDRTETPASLRINVGWLLGKQLEEPLVAVVDSLSQGFVAHISGLPIFGYGDVVTDAVEALKHGIENIGEEREFVAPMLLSENRRFGGFAAEERGSAEKVLLP